MFRKVIVFELFEMIRKKKRIVRTAFPGPGSAPRSGQVRYGNASRHMDQKEKKDYV